MAGSRRIALAGLMLFFFGSTAGAQTLRFHTNVGTFDMRLNPTNDPNLQPLVDNLVAYVGLGRYSSTAINRAVEGAAGTADDFVLQMGGLLAFPTSPDLWAELHEGIDPLSPVTVDANNDGQVDFSTQPNTRGTVSLALQQGRPNSGTSSFFINLGDNSSILDSQGFVPFATIQNMGTVNEIMRLMQRDLSRQAGAPGNLTYTDVPLTEDGQIVVLQQVTVASANPNFSFVGPIASALQMQQRGSSAASAASAASSAALLSSLEESVLAEVPTEPDAELALLPPVASATSPVVGSAPEPTGVTMGAMAWLAVLRARRRAVLRGR